MSCEKGHGNCALLISFHGSSRTSNKAHQCSSLINASLALLGICAVSVAGILSYSNGKINETKKMRFREVTGGGEEKDC